MEQQLAAQDAFPANSTYPPVHNIRAELMWMPGVTQCLLMLCQDAKAGLWLRPRRGTGLSRAQGNQTGSKQRSHRVSRLDRSSSERTVPDRRSSRGPGRSVMASKGGKRDVPKRMGSGSATSITTLGRKGEPLLLPGRILASQTFSMPLINLNGKG